MRRFTQDWASGHLVNMVSNVRRRRSWFVAGASAGQLANLALAGAEFGLRREKMRALPVMLKVDISPACNLGCTFCVHATEDAGGRTGLLAPQQFAGRNMAVAAFRSLVEQARGRSSAVSLYYLGDPLLHPNLNELCGISASAGLKTHISSNFSFRLSDEKIRDLTTSGLTHLTVCVDGMSQERFEKTRVGGRIDWVLDNLERVLATRRRLGLKRPEVEVQFIKFQHNLDEVERCARWCAEHGVDQFTDYWGNLHNYADVAPGRYQVFGPKRNRKLPQCSWPHFSLQVKYDGDVIPCCYYRQTEQYRPGGDARPVGNVFTDGLRGVWNSPGYQQLRRMVSNPARAGREPGTENAFCAGCPTIYDTDVAEHELVADAHEWDDVYQISPAGQVERR